MIGYLNGNSHPPVAWRPDPGRTAGDHKEARNRTLLIVDPHPIMRRGYRALIEDIPGVDVCAEASSLHDALEALERCKPDIMITSVALDEGDGFSLVREARRRYPWTRILMVSHQDASLYTQRALDAGADAYLERSDLPDRGCDIVRSLLAINK